MADQGPVVKKDDINFNPILVALHPNTWKPSQFLSDLVQFNVKTEHGSKKEEFRVQRSIACSHSNVFRGVFQGKGCSELNVEGDPDAFEYLVHWLHTHSIKDTKPSMEQLLLLWVFADMYQIPALQNAAVDQYFSIIEYGAALDDPELGGFHDDFLPFMVLEVVWTRTKSDCDCKLRKLLIHQIAFGLKPVDFEKYDSYLPPSMLYQLLQFHTELAFKKQSAWDHWKNVKPAHYYVE